MNLKQRIAKLMARPAQQGFDFGKGEFLRGGPRFKAKLGLKVRAVDAGHRAGQVGWKWIKRHPVIAGTAFVGQAAARDYPAYYTGVKVGERRARRGNR